jgi:hypothetical protein
MKPPGKTSLNRMQRTALLEAERIEISQDARVFCGLQKEPMPSQVQLRDDFMGIVRLIDTIMSDTNLQERIEARGRAAAQAVPPAPAPIDDDAVVAVAEEAEPT